MISHIVVSWRVRLLLRKPAAIDEVFWGRERGKLDLVLLCDVLALNLKAQALVKGDGLLVVGAHVQFQVGWVVLEHVVHEFATDALALATRPHAYAHEVATLRHFDIVLPLLLAEFLHVILRWFLRQEGCITDDCLRVGLLSHDDLVD